MFSPNIRTVTFSAAVFRLGHIFSGFTVREESKEKDAESRQEKMKPPFQRVNQVAAAALAVKTVATMTISNNDEPMMPK